VPRRIGWWSVVGSEEREFGHDVTREYGISVLLLVACVVREDAWLDLSATPSLEFSVKGKKCNGIFFFSAITVNALFLSEIIPRPLVICSVFEG
jgi:hypothetical protein